MTRRILVQNEKDTLSTSVAIADLHMTITECDPDFVVLNEWSKVRDRATKAMAKKLGYGFKRPWRGGGPVLWRLGAYKPLRIRSKMIARPQRVGRLPGRRSFLGASWLTIAVFTVIGTDKRIAVDGFHMTAEVQMGAHYRQDAAHAKRVARHKTERAGVERVGKRQLAANIEAYPAGDSNFDGMDLDGFVNCWDDHPGGDLGGRAVTQCFAEGRAKTVRTIKTHSDHFAVVVTY